MRFKLSAPPTADRTPLHRLGALVAAIFCSGSGVVALWVTVTGARISGGLWFLPDAMNQAVGRAVFGVCGLICFAIAWTAFRDTRASDVRGTQENASDAVVASASTGTENTKPS